MIIDGRTLAKELKDKLRLEVAEFGQPLTLAVIACAPNFETLRYLDIKEQVAEELGIIFRKQILSATVDTTSVKRAVADATSAQGIVVQLPLPPALDTEAILNAIPSTHDVDVLNPQTTALLSPVVGAVAEIIKHYEVPVYNRHVVVVGSGRLVGQPVARWFMEQGAAVSVVTKDTADIRYYTQAADIIVLGAGVPGLLRRDMVKSGVVVFDAGTSEVGGLLVGDADPSVAEKAALFTPVPGGIGPLTIVALFSNLLTLARRRYEK